jgi:cobalt/nickel transport system permease protein
MPIAKEVNVLSTDFYANHHPWRAKYTSAKAFSCFLCFVISFTLLSPTWLLLVGILSITILSRSEYFNLKQTLKTWLSVFLFISVGILGVIIGYGTSADLMWLSLKMGTGFIGIYKLGLITALHLLIRSLSCFIALYTYIHVTPMKETFRLLKKLKIPLTFIEILEISYRFIFIFLKEVSIIYQAQEMRLGYSSKKKAIRSLGLIAGSLFIRIFDKTDKMHLSIVLRHGEDR